MIYLKQCIQVADNSVQVKCEVNLGKISQEASDGNCLARYMGVRNFYRT